MKKVVTFGEIMLRLSPPGFLRFSQTDRFDVVYGSGDVLSGIITGFLAQGYAAKWAAILGVYLHGLAGDLVVASQQSEASLIASDIIENLGGAFQTFVK